MARPNQRSKTRRRLRKTVKRRCPSKKPKKRRHRQKVVKRRCHLCPVCQEIQALDRVFRDNPKEPFLIYVRRLARATVTVVATRQHGVSLQRVELVTALDALRDVGTRRHGIAFTIHVNGMVAGHWTARAIPLRLRHTLSA